MKAKLNYKNIDKELKDMTEAHNKMCYDVYAMLGMLSANMSAVKGAPTATRVALWRDDIASIQSQLKTVKP